MNTTNHPYIVDLSTWLLKKSLSGWFLISLVFSGCSAGQVQAGAPTATYTAIPAEILPTMTPVRTPILPLTVSKNTPVPTKVVCQEKQGRIEDVEIPNSFLSYSLRAKVYLPPCYSETPDVPYPYLVMIHGMLYNFDQWDRLGIDEAADELISSGEVDPFLIIMPNEEQTTANPDEEKFGNVITEDLIPWMEAKYPVCKDRSCRAIGGLSRGAGWAVHIGLSRPKYFSAIGAHSLPIFIGDLPSTPRWLLKIPKKELPRVYIDIGLMDGGIVPASQFEQVLTAHNVPHEWHINNGEHTESYWSSHVKAYLRWYADGWMPPDLPVILN